MKVKRMEKTEILRRIWPFSENKIKSSESFSKQPTQLIVELNSSLRHIIVTLESGIDVAHSIYIRTVNSYVTIMRRNDELSSTMS